MITLQDILSKKELIIQACEVFGFSEPKLHRCDKDPYLYLVVTPVDRRHSALKEFPLAMRQSFMESYLSQILECQVVLFPTVNITLELPKILARSIGITSSIEAISKIFGQSSSQQQFSPLRKEDVGDEAYAEWQRRQQEDLELIKKLGLFVSAASTTASMVKMFSPSAGSDIRRADDDHVQTDRIIDAASSLIDTNRDLSRAFRQNPELFDRLKEHYLNLRGNCQPANTPPIPV